MIIEKDIDINKLPSLRLSKMLGAVEDYENEMPAVLWDYGELIGLADDDIVHLMEVMQNAADMIKRADYTPARSLLLVELDKMKK